MTNQRRVILYGDSLILEGIRANLGGCPDLVVISLAPPLPKAQALGELFPDVIIFDLEIPRPESVFELLQTRPNLLLAGIDVATNQMMLWSGKQAHALKISDLVKAIRTTRQPKLTVIRPA